MVRRVGRSVRALVGGLLLSAAALSLTACAEGHPDGPLAITVEDALRHYEAYKAVDLDFDTLITGDWTRLVLSCGASARQIDDALGFDWEQPARTNVRKSEAYIFATDTEVEQFFGPLTWAPFDDREYVSACLDDGSDDVTEVFDRSDSVISYELRNILDQNTWVPIAHAAEDTTAG
jgi:hypothetical protein